VESAACGFLVSQMVHARLGGPPESAAPPPATTAMGALYRHVTGEAHPDGHAYQPSNVIFGLFPPLPGRVKKADKRARYAERGRRDFQAWLASRPGRAPLQEALTA